MTVADLVADVIRFGGTLKCIRLPLHQWEALPMDQGVLDYGLFYIGNCEIRREA
jgi:hypothetical protein